MRAHSPLVILPGLLCDGRMFGAQVREFDAEVVDGFYGGADRLEKMASYALNRIPDRCILIGHSMGGRVALEIWRRAPDRVAGLVLADTGVHDVRTGEAASRYALHDLGKTQGSEALVNAWLPPMVGPRHRTDAALMARLSAMAISAGTKTYAMQIEAMLHRPSLFALLPTVTCPTLVIVGRDDDWAPVSQHSEITAAIPSARLSIIDDAGHMAPDEEPKRFNDAVRAWLNLCFAPT